MGFSLGRVLAGAIAGGAAGVVGVADQQLKEAATLRQGDELLAHQKELARLQDTLVGDRQDRVAEAATRRATEARGKVGSAISSARTALKERGIEPYSQRGLTEIADMLGEQGYTEHADKYRTDAINLQRNADAHTDRADAIVARKQDHAERMAAISATRAAKVDTKTADQEAKDTRNLERDIDRNSRFEFNVRGEKAKRDFTGAVKGFAAEARDNDLSFGQTKSLVNGINAHIERRVSAGIDPDRALSEALAVARTTWAPVTAAPAPAPTNPSAPAVPPAKARTPGIFERAASQRLDPNDPDASRFSYD